MGACAFAGGVDFNTHFIFAVATEDGFCSVLFGGPALFKMICKGFVAFVASVVLVAALKFYGDDVKRASLVGASCLLVEIKAAGHGLWVSLTHNISLGERFYDFFLQNLRDVATMSALAASPMMKGKQPRAKQFLSPTN